MTKENAKKKTNLREQKKTTRQVETSLATKSAVESIKSVWAEEIANLASVEFSSVEEIIKALAEQVSKRTGLNNQTDVFAIIKELKDEDETLDNLLKSLITNSPK
jgi:hypothetical protein